LSRKAWRSAAEDSPENLDEEGLENLTLALQRPVPEVMDIVGCPLIEPYEEKVWSRIGGFFYRPYWTGGWIMQEATAIEHPTLWYGNKTCNLQEAWTAALTRSSLWKRKPWGNNKPPVGDFSDFWRIFQIRYFRHLTENAEVKLLEVLSLLRGAKTADPRNIIYAGLCLATDVPQGSIAPDAAKTVAEVHQDVAWYSICHSRDPLDFLGYCCRFYVKWPSSLKDQIDTLSIDWTPQIISFDLASWIPQWANEFPSPKAFPKNCAGDDGIQKRLYNVWGLKAEESQYIGSKIPPFFIIGSILLAQGFVLDILKQRKRQT